MPFVLITSLNAIGIPSPGESSHTWRNEFSSASRSSIAARYAEKISSDDASPAASRSLTCCAVSGSVSIMRRHPEESGFAVWRVRQRILDRQRFPRLVVGPHVHEVERVRGRLDVREVE